MVHVLILMNVSIPRVVQIIITPIALIYRALMNVDVVLDIQSEV
jgi:hypothetical protein